MSPVPQSGGAGSRHVGFGGAERRGGDGSDQRLLPLLPQGQLLHTLKDVQAYYLSICTVSVSGSFTYVAYFIF